MGLGLTALLLICVTMEIFMVDGLPAKERSPVQKTDEHFFREVESLLQEVEVGGVAVEDSGKSGAPGNIHDPFAVASCMMVVRKAVLAGRKTVKELDAVKKELEYRTKDKKYDPRTQEEITRTAARTAAKEAAEAQYQKDRSEKLKVIHMMPNGPEKVKLLAQDAKDDAEWRRVALMPESPKREAAEFFIAEKQGLAYTKELISEMTGGKAKNEAMTKYTARVVSFDKVAKMPWGKAKQDAIEKIKLGKRVSAKITLAANLVANATKVNATATKVTANNTKATKVTNTTKLVTTKVKKIETKGDKKQMKPKAATESLFRDKRFFSRAYELLQVDASDAPVLSQQQIQLLEQQKQQKEYKLRAGARADDVASCMLTLKDSVTFNKENMLDMIPVLDSIHSTTKVEPEMKQTPEKKDGQSTLDYRKIVAKHWQKHKHEHEVAKYKYERKHEKADRYYHPAASAIVACKNCVPNLSVGGESKPTTDSEVAEIGKQNINSQGS